MTDPADKPRTTPEPGQPSADGNLGGMLSTADRGLADALQRSSERGDDSATGLAASGNALAGGQAPRSDLGGKNEPGSAPGATGPAGPAAAQAGVAAAAEGRAQGADRAQPGKATSSGAAAGQAPTPGGDSTPPRDEGPLESFGRAISEVVTGTVDDRVAPLAPIAPNTPNTRR